MPIQIIPTSFEQVTALLASGPVRRVNEALAAARGLEILEESAMGLNLIRGDISVSGITAEEIEALLRAEGDRVIRFGSAWMNQPADPALQEEYPEGEDVDDEAANEQLIGLSQSAAITQAIRYNFLAHRSQKELIEYLANRRTPHHRKFARELAACFAALDRARAGR